MRRVAAFAAVMLASLSAMAGEPDSYKLTVTPSELNIIGQALAAQPWGQVNGVIVSLRSQRMAQQAAHDKPAAAPKTSEKK